MKLFAKTFLKNQRFIYAATYSFSRELLELWSLSAFWYVNNLHSTVSSLTQQKKLNGKYNKPYQLFRKKYKWPNLEVNKCIQ